MPTGATAYDGFLSHNTRDKPAVQRIDTHLRASGLRMWLDDRELGDEWHGPMQAAIDEVPACIIFLGPNGSYRNASRNWLYLGFIAVVLALLALIKLKA